MAGQYIEAMSRLRRSIPWSSWLPSQCEVCRRWEGAALCSDCIGRYALPRARCERCGLRTGVPLPACGDCLRDPPPCARCVCAADYDFPWDRLIAGLKFQGRTELALVLAPRLVAAVRDAGLPRPDLVLPVPLAPGRLSERGYNQAWELARRTAAALQLPARADLLLRHRDTERQAELTRAERQRNLRTAFGVEPAQAAVLRGRHVALVDDVMTTGATVREAGAVLLRAGVARLDVWVLARTPEH
jgi:ComF family protein